jgi:hypothetical protein
MRWWRRRGFRVIGVDDRGNSATWQLAGQSARVFILPDDAPVMLKAEARRHKADVFNAIMRSAHAFGLEFNVTAPEDLTEAEVITKLRACGGAHQPTSYEL